MKRTIYGHLGYFNEVGDIRQLTRKSADEIIDYWKKGYGAFYEDSEPRSNDTKLVLEEEDENIKSGDVKVTSDGKYAIADSSWDVWAEQYADAEDGDDSDCYIDIYELMPTKKYTKRFYYKTYIDIEVEALSEEMAEEFADNEMDSMDDRLWKDLLADKLEIVSGKFLENEN